MPVMDKKLLEIGEFFVTKKPMLLRTVLGSCVSVCLYNRFNGHAAMNHFLIPSASYQEMQTDPGKCGKSSCEMIVQALMDADPNVSHYTAQVFGGANMFDLADSIGDLGERNARIAEQVLTEYRIRIIHQETGGTKGRSIYFYTAKNIVNCHFLDDVKERKKLRTQYAKIFYAVSE